MPDYDFKLTKWLINHHNHCKTQRKRDNQSKFEAMYIYYLLMTCNPCMFRARQFSKQGWLQVIKKKEQSEKLWI